METTASAELTEQITENRYDENQLISLKVPVTGLAYYNNSKEFEWVDGSIDIQGVRYKYVKRRIYNDTLEVMCIPDAASIRLGEINTAFFRWTNGLSRTGQDRRQGAHTRLLHPLSPDYYAIGQAFQLQLPSVCSSTGTATAVIPVTSVYRPVPENPPEL